MPSPQARHDPPMSIHPRRSRPASPRAWRTHWPAATSGITVSPTLETCLLQGLAGNSRIHRIQAPAAAAPALSSGFDRARAQRGAAISMTSVTGRRRSRLRPARPDRRRWRPFRPTPGPAPLVVQHVEGVEPGLVEGQVALDVDPLGARVLVGPGDVVGAAPADV